MLAALLAIPSPSIWTEKVPIDANGVSGDGKVVYGSLDQRPCCWSKITGTDRLRLQKGSSGYVTGSSTDGRELVGVVNNGNTDYVYMWTAGKPQTIAACDPNTHPAISADGTTIVGEALVSERPRSIHGMAFRWRANAGVEILAPPQVEHRLECRAAACSCDGTLVVGTLEVEDIVQERRMIMGSGPGAGHWFACAWDANGLVKLLPGSNWTDTAAEGCSNDGRVVVGWVNGHGKGGPCVWRLGNESSSLQVLDPSGAIGSPRESSGGTIVGTFSYEKQVKNGVYIAHLPLLWQLGDTEPTWLNDFLTYHRVAMPRDGFTSCSGLSEDGSVILIHSGVNATRRSWLLHVRPGFGALKWHPDFDPKVTGH